MARLRSSDAAPDCRLVEVDREGLQDPKAPPRARELEAAAKVLEVTIKAAEVDRIEEIDGAMQALASQHVDVVIVLQTPKSARILVI